ncbi:MAG TPA: HPF/RaiA family ribosome-associated protein [Pseudobdellovibrionaceae bacterium]|nr:HPF/RaiA family ribosome-associated protein [Pseudobdellovibrionaceae bacterium]
MDSEQQDTPASNESTEAPGFPYEISFIDCDSSQALRSKIEKHLLKLERVSPRITDCKVMIRLRQKTHGQKRFHIHIQLDIPGQRLVVSREPQSGDSHSDAYIAVHDAFLKLTRRLEDFMKQRTDRRIHSDPKETPSPRSNDNL